MARSSKRAKKGTVRVNFKDVESRKTPGEGDYLCRVLEAESGKSGAGNEQISFTCEIAKGEFKGVKLYLHCPLMENSLWKLHAFLTALGVDVPEDEMDIDLSDLVDLEFVGVVTHELYNGRKRAKLTDFASKEDYDGDDADDDDEDEKPAKGKKSKKSSKRDDDDDEDDEDKKPSKKSKSKASAKSKKDDDDEDDDDEDEKPSKSKKSKGKTSKKLKKIDRSDVEDMDEEELQELIDEHDLDVDLDDYKKLPKKVAAVIDALEEEDLLEEDDD